MIKKAKRNVPEVTPSPRIERYLIQWFNDITLFHVVPTMRRVVHNVELVETINPKKSSRSGDDSDLYSWRLGTSMIKKSYP